MVYGILLPKLFWPTLRKNCSSDREKLGREFAKFLRSLKQYKQWKVRTIFNELEQLKLKLEKIIGIEKHAGKVRKIENKNDVKSFHLDRENLKFFEYFE